MKKFDSNEEQEFFWWCEEAEQNGIIKQFVFKPESFTLSSKITVPVEKKLKTKTKIVEKHLFHPHIYSPDFLVYPVEDLPGLLRPGRKGYYIDTKGGFMNRGAKQEFSINRKWVWAEYRIYINKVVPKDFFKKTFVPEKARYTPKKRDLKKCYIGFETVDEWSQAG